MKGTPRRVGISAAGPLPDIAMELRPWKRSRLWLAVCVLPTLAEMRAALGTFDGASELSQQPLLLGCCVSVSCRAPRTARDRGLFGVVFLSREALGVATVTHEMAHAAFRAVERRGLQVRHWEAAQRPGPSAPAASEEERYCAALDHLCAGFYREAYRQGLLQ